MTTKQLIKEYVDELMKGFDGDYLDFCNYVYKVLDKKLSMNKNDPKYKKMSEDFEKSIAFSAACDLVFKGRFQPSGYTEPLLHQKRLEKKSIN